MSIGPKNLLNLLPAADRTKLTGKERQRYIYAIYYDPVQDPLRYNPDRNFLLSPNTETGRWYLPPADSLLPSAFKLTEKMKDVIAAGVIGVKPVQMTTVVMGKKKLEWGILGGTFSTKVSGNIRQREAEEPQPEQEASTRDETNADDNVGGLLEEDELEPPSSSDDDDEDETDEKAQRARRTREESQRDKMRADRFIFVDLQRGLTTEADRIFYLAWKSVKVGTQLDYASYLRQILKSGRSLNWQGFNSYIMQRTVFKQKSERSKAAQGGMAAKTIEQYRFAMQHYLTAIGQEGEAAQAAAMSRGIRRFVGDSLVTRGGIRWNMVKQLISRKTVREREDLRDAYVVLSATGVRQNQLIGLSLEDCTWDKTRKVWRVVVHRNHKGRGSATSASTEFECHYTNPDSNEEFNKLIAKTRSRVSQSNPTPLLCPNWGKQQIKAARSLLVKEAKALKWDSRLEWRLHGLRDGAAIDAFMRNRSQKEIEGLLAIQDVTGHVSIEMLRHYAIPNAERLRFQKMKLDTAVLRAVGVVDDLEGSYRNETEPLPKMLRTSKMKKIGDASSLKEAQKKRVKKEKVEKKVGKRVKVEKKKKMNSKQKK